jgi:predicted Zn finger-like uncharacterized protein
MMLTRCPECATVFRVNPDQLKARQGRVRCGRCNRVFNAIDALIENVPAHLVSPPTAEPAAHGSVEAEQHAAPIVEPAGQILNDERTSQPLVVEDQGKNDAVAMAATKAIQTAAQQPATTAGEDAAAAELLPDAQEHNSADSPAPADKPAQSAASVHDDPIITELPIAEPPSSEPLIAEPQARPAPAMEPLLHEPPLQPPAWPWVALGVLFAILLAGQAALFYRVELAIQYPQLLTYLAGTCAQIGCDMPLPRHIEQVGIEASDLNPDSPRKGRLHLSATLKNRADFAQEYPHLELTLTDTQDQPLVRRAFAPAEYLTTASPPAAFAARAEATVALNIDASSVPASGYRLYVFYP